MHQVSIDLSNFSKFYMPHLFSALAATKPKQQIVIELLCCMIDEGRSIGLRLTKSKR